MFTGVQIDSFDEYLMVGVVITILAAAAWVALCFFIEWSKAAARLTSRQFVRGISHGSWTGAVLGIVFFDDPFGDRSVEMVALFIAGGLLTMAVLYVLGGVGRVLTRLGA